MIGETEPSIQVVLAVLATAVVTQAGAWVVKRTKSPETSPPLTLDEVRAKSLLEEWQKLAGESRQELFDCRQEREHQQEVIAGLTRRVAALEGVTQKQDEKIDELRLELNQWRDGRRVPDGFRLQRLDPPAQ